MKYNVAFFFFLFCNYSQSQNYFNKVIPSSEYYVESAYTKILELDSNLLAFFLHSSYREKPGQENKICNLDGKGSVLKIVNFLDSINYNNILDIIRVNDGFILTGLKYNSITQLSDYWIAKCDYKLDTIWTTTMRGSNNRCLISKAVEVDSNKLILIGNDINVRTNGTWINNNSQVLSVDRDGKLNFIKSLRGQDTINLEGYFDLVIDNNRNTYSCGYSYKKTLDQEPIIVKLSPDGNLIWRKQMVEPKYNEVLLDIFYQRDGTLLCIGDSYDGTNSGKEFSYILLMNIDTSGLVKFTKRIIKGYLNESYECIQDHNGNLICGGSYKANQNYIKDGWIVKFTNTGDSLWSRVINHDDSITEGFYFISEASDGGYYLTGYSWVPGDNSSKAWVVKTDSFGCLIPGCEKVVSVEDIKNGKEKAFVFFPNPVHERFFFLSRISSSQKHYLMIYNLQGQLMQTYPFTPYEGHQYQVDVNQNISSGEYLMQIHDQEGNIVAWEKMIIQ